MVGSGLLPDTELGRGARRRFLMIRSLEKELAAPPIHVVLHRVEELKRRVPVNR